MAIGAERSCTASLFSSALVHCVLGGALLVCGAPFARSRTGGRRAIRDALRNLSRRRR